MMHIGDIRVESLIDGEAVLDHSTLYGGAHPPTEADWEPYRKYLDHCTGEQINTVGSHLIRVGDRLVLHDTGSGPRPWGQNIFASGGLRSALWAAGVSPLDITDLTFSHLHLDHIGWTTLDGKPFFPNATIHIDKREWDYYTDPSYVPLDWENQVTSLDGLHVVGRFAPVLDRIEFFEGDEEILPGVNALEASGHSPGHTVLELVSDGEKGLLIGDLVHTQGELVNAWEFYVYHDSEKALAAIDHFRKILVDGKLPFAAAHFPGMVWGQLVRDGANDIAYRTI